MKKGVQIFILAFVFCFLFIKPIYSQEVLAKIYTKSVDNFINIKAFAYNKDATIKDEYSYLLFSLKKGGEGNYSRNSQSGIFSLGSFEKKNLSSMRINIRKGESCKIYLFIRKNNQLISKDSTLIYADEKVQKKIISEQNFEIKGIVTERLLTKVGKDFYDFFYQMYSTSGSQYPFIINIKEKPYFGRSTIIIVEVDDKKIIEFYTKPDLDYLKSTASATLQKLAIYAQQRKILFSNTRF